ncbi:MAG: phosphotransferase [Roseibium sp.]|uniref:phosphotransferase n=1 Tax=Parasphingorhabdus sp. TaxID=2709688 RepID=UPI00329A3DE7
MGKFDEGEKRSFCNTVWGKGPLSISYPGGAGRKTVIVDLEDGRYAVSKRASPSRAKLEALVLQKLSPSGKVPAYVTQDGEYVVQEVVNGDRLSEVLEYATPEKRTEKIILAGKTLFELQQAGRNTGLIEIAPKIGADPAWKNNLAQVPLRLAERMGFSLTGYDAEKIGAWLEKGETAFVKWDARPGNAFVANDNRIIWFDWEHCGVGSTEDDLVWLLADEWTPISPDAEAALLAHYSLHSSVSIDEITHRFKTKAVLHSMIRLMLIFDRKTEGRWPSIKLALAQDRVGVSLPHINRLCRRTADWVDTIPEFRCLESMIVYANEYTKKQQHDVT